MAPETTIGLSGCGSIGAVHAKSLRALGVRLRFQSRRRESAVAFAREHGGEALDTYDQLLEACDGVVIATPPESHTDAVCAALSAGRGVMVEKPLCVTAQELARIEAAAAASDGALMVAENYYYKPSTQLLRETVTWGGVGEVANIQLGKRTKQIASGWKAAHGALLEGGIHYVALLGDLIDAAASRRWVTAAEEGAELTDEVAAACVAPIVDPAVTAAQFPTHDGTPERQSIVEVAHEGLRARLHYAWDEPALLKGTFQHGRIEGEAGRIVFECNGIYVDTRGPGRKGLTFPGFGDLMGYGAMAADFVDCVRSGRAPYSDLARARRDLRIVWSAYEHLPG